MEKTIFSVNRNSKTAKPFNVGNFDNLEDAKKAMVEHFVNSSKRGKFNYRISEDELKECNGMVFRITTYNLSGNGPYSRTFTHDELKLLASKGEK